MVKKNKIKKSVTLDGLMTLGQLDDGRHTADFACCEDGNRPIFREDNSSMSHGRNKRFYFVFSLEDDRVDELAVELVRQARIIAQKVSMELIGQ